MKDAIGFDAREKIHGPHITQKSYVISLVMIMPTKDYTRSQ